MAPDKTPYDNLLESLVDLGKRAFDPSIPQSSRADSRQEFDSLLQNTGTVPVIPALNTLVRPGRVPEWLRSEFVRLLALVPLRRHGVRATLEFVFSVHPSGNTGPTGPEYGKPPPTSITPEAMKMASRLLSSPPSSVDPETWFSGIAPQLLDLLDGRVSLDLTKVAAYVVGFGILGRRESGAPGKPGWRYFAEPMLKAIKPDASLASLPQDSSSDDLVDLTKPTVLVSAADLATALRRLQHLVVSHPNPGLSRRLLEPLLLPLWALTSRGAAEDKAEDEYRRPARNLLTILLKISNSLRPVSLIIENLLYNGEKADGKAAWLYDNVDEASVHIIIPRQQDPRVDSINLDLVEERSRKIVSLIGSIFSDEDVSSIFLDVFNRWMKSGSRQKPVELLIKAEDVTDKSRDPLSALVDGQVLQSMMLKFPEKLASQPGHMLKLADDLLSDQSQLGSDEEALSVALSLLNLIATTPSFKRSLVDKELMESLESSLDRLNRTGSGHVATTAGNMAAFLKYRDDLEDPVDFTHSQANRQVEDRKLYALAVSYMSQKDSPAPVRAEGINMIQKLIVANSPVLDVPAVLILMSSLLVENDEYINLRVIKVYTQLANKHPRSVTRELIDRYVDANELASVDTRLRFGEALVQVVERLGQTFAGETAEQICQAVLMLAGRRGHRPKTQAKQARDEKLRKMKAARGEAQDDSDDDDDADLPGSRRIDNEILRQIVEGWGSNRGSEDVRVRASALSVFAAGLETNVAGVGPELVSSAVDLCVQVLTVEPEAEKGILRRAAALVLLGFVRALARAREEGRQLGFGMTDDSRADVVRILEYVAATDNDGLARRHASDVVESLENWRMSALLPVDEGQRGGLSSITRLAGLEIDVRNLEVGDGRRVGRPVIEEVE